MTKPILPIANGLALIFTILINYISNAGMLNGNTMKTISDKYFNYFTPAGYAFSIWGLIYLGLFGFVLYTGYVYFKKKEDGILSKIGVWFILSCLANALWVVAWLSDYTALSVLVMMLLLFSLLKIVINTRMELDGHPFKDYLFIYWPFALYSGWITVALIANIAAYLTKLGWNGWGLSAPIWTITMIVVAGLINILMIQIRNLREYGVVGIWALLAIAASNSAKDGPVSIIYTCYLISALILLFIVINGFKNRRKSLQNM